MTALSARTTALLAAMLLLPQCTSLPDPSLGQRPRLIERSKPVSHIPLTLRGGKLVVPATVNGKAETFILDTGSPTMIAKSFADAIGLVLKGQNIGIDAHGRKVQMANTVIPKLKLVDVTFHSVPALIFDFTSLELGPCFFSGGVIGSEILAGSAWRFAVGEKRLSVAASVKELPSADRPAKEWPLVVGGYASEPLVEYQMGGIRDKALFDTGNSHDVVLYEPVAAKVQAILPGSELKGFGSAGVSAGGRAADRELRFFRLKHLLLGDGKESIGPLQATTRPTPPTLLGAGLLERYNIVLDYGKSQTSSDSHSKIRFEPRPDAQPHRAFPGYDIDIVDGVGRVTKLMTGSAAAKAGLKLGDRITELNGRSLEFAAGPTRTDSGKCQAARWLSTSFDPRAAATLKRAGSAALIKIPAQNPQ